MAKCERGNSEKEGLFVKTLDNAFGVQRQQYLGGGGGGGIYWQPCHKALKVMCYACAYE